MITLIHSLENLILISHWVDEFFEKLLGEDYKHTRYHSFENTGCLITADSSEDSKVNLEGLDNYFVPPFPPTSFS